MAVAGFLKWGVTLEALIAIMSLLAFLGIALVDLDTYIIPDSLCVIVALLGMGFAVATGQAGDLVNRIFAGLLGAEAEWDSEMRSLLHPWESYLVCRGWELRYSWDLWWVPLRRFSCLLRKGRDGAMQSPLARFSRRGRLSHSCKAMSCVMRMSAGLDCEQNTLRTDLTSVVETRTLTVTYG
jgi:hypothetical protein